MTPFYMVVVLNTRVLAEMQTVNGINFSREQRYSQYIVREMQVYAN